jgi:hypothetical protein
MYTEDEVTVLKQYPNISVEELAVQLGKTERSIIGKLSRLGIYQRKTYVSKSGSPPISKLEIVAEIENALSMKLEGLEKSPKGVLLSLRDKLSGGSIRKC